MSKELISERTISTEVDLSTDVVKADGERVRFEVEPGGAAVFEYYDPATGRIVPIKLVSGPDDTEPAVCRIPAKEGSVRVKCTPIKTCQVKCQVEEKKPKEVVEEPRR